MGCVYKVALAQVSFLALWFLLLLIILPVLQTLLTSGTDRVGPSVAVGPSLPYCWDKNWKGSILVLASHLCLGVRVVSYIYVLGPKLVCIFSIACYVSCLSHTARFDHPKIIWRVQIVDWNLNEIVYSGPAFGYYLEDISVYGWRSHILMPQFYLWRTFVKLPVLCSLDLIMVSINLHSAFYACQSGTSEVNICGWYWEVFLLVCQF